MDGSLGSELEIEKSEVSKCGAVEFYNSLCDVLEDVNMKNMVQRDITIKVGMRMCELDERSIEGLCASSALVKDKLGIVLQIDCTMNAEACDDDDTAVVALEKGDSENEMLREMSERFLTSLDQYNDFVDAEDDDYGYDDQY